jgi:glycolate oxidase FAD binding subunit
MRFALSDGTLARNGARVVKNVAGYDLCRLFTGSLGTLGVVVEATLRLYPLPEVGRTAVVVCPTLYELSEILERLRVVEVCPQFVELLNPEARQRIGARRAWSVVVGFEGAAETVAWQIRRVRETANVCGLRSIEIPPAGRRAATAILAGLALDAPDLVVCRTSVRGSVVPTLLEGLDPGWPAWGRASLGELRVCVPADDGTPARVRALRERVRELGGFLVVERAPAEMKPDLDVWGPPGREFALMRAVKERFDPNGILNPGRFVGGL